MAQKGNYTHHRHFNKSDIMTDKVMEPLTNLFTDLVAQLKLLTRSGHSSHNGFPIPDSMLMASTINEMSSIWITIWTITVRQLLDTMITNGEVGMVQVPSTVLPKDLTPGFMRLSLAVSVA